MDNSTALKHSSYNLTDLEWDQAGRERQDLGGRIRSHDHTGRKPDPTEIADPLGWLSVTNRMWGELGSNEGFGSGVRRVGFRHGVLLGMGGNSLGPEVLRWQAAGGAAQSVGGHSVRPASPDGTQSGRGGG